MLARCNLKCGIQTFDESSPAISPCCRTTPGWRTISAFPAPRHRRPCPRRSGCRIARRNWKVLQRGFDRLVADGAAGNSSGDVWKTPVRHARLSGTIKPGMMVLGHASVFTKFGATNSSISPPCNVCADSRVFWDLTANSGTWRPHRRYGSQVCLPSRPFCSQLMASANCLGGGMASRWRAWPSRFPLFDNARGNRPPAWWPKTLWRDWQRAGRHERLERLYP